MKNKQEKNGPGFWVAYALEALASWHLGAQAAEKVFAFPERSNLETKVQAVQPAEAKDVNIPKLVYKNSEPHKPYEPNYVDVNEQKEVNKPTEPNYADVSDINALTSNIVYATRISQKGIDLIKEFEGFSPAPYEDGNGFSIGYGHFIKPGENYTTITKEQAEELLKQELSWVENTISNYVFVPLTQNQYDALCSFVYNIGREGFKNSTLLKKLNDKNHSEAAEEFRRWNKSQEKVLEGLITRRAKEKELFLSDTH